MQALGLLSDRGSKSQAPGSISLIAFTFLVFFLHEIWRIYLFQAAKSLVIYIAALYNI